MKTRRWMRCLAAIMALALVMATPLQASEYVTEDTTEAVPVVASDDAAAEEELSSEEDIIVEETDLAEAISAESTAPAAEISEDGPTVEVTEVSEVPSYEKRVTFYLDWNGINGLFGHCLTCTRGYNDGEKPMFTAEDAAVYNFNFKTDSLEQFESGLTWDDLRTLWTEKTFDGYTFKGWAKKPDAMADEDLIWQDTEIEDGVSFYAVWEKGSKVSWRDNEPPKVDPLNGIRIMAGDGTTFTSGTLSSSKDAKVGESFKLKLFCTPIGAEKKDVIWTLKVTEGLESSKSLAAVFNQSAETMTVTVNADGSGRCDGNIDGLTVEAEGETLTITNTNGKTCSIVVSATAKSNEDKIISSNASATLSFAHQWVKSGQKESKAQAIDEEEQAEETFCEPGITVTYTCACGATKEEKTPPIEHIYDNRNPDNMDEPEHRNCRILKAPTCTEAGEKKLICLRCSKEQKDSVPISPLGHEWSEEERTPSTCNKDTITKYCMRDGCTVQETSLVPANEIHSELHGWVETRRDQISCTEDRVYERCVHCGETKSYTAPAKNPHSYEYQSRTPVDCQHVIYTFKCVHCGASEVMLKTEENHEWSGWTASTTWNSETGMMERTLTRRCMREHCDVTQTRTWTDVAASQPGTKPESETQTEISGEQAENSVDNNVFASSGASESSVSKSDTPATYGQTSGAATVSAPLASKNNSVAKTGWQKVGKKKYYYVNGVKQTGWQKIGKKKYYFNKNGVMQTGWKTIGKKKYYFGKNGVMRTGKQKIGKKTYVFGKNGALKK